jgi:hypothetical protein
MRARPVGKDYPRPWNKGLLVGQKNPPQPKHVWSIGVRLEIAHMWRDRAAEHVMLAANMPRATFTHHIHDASRLTRQSSLIFPPASASLTASVSR